jgi:hypothetical protein
MAVRSWYSTTTISRDSPSIESISTGRVAHSIRHNLLGGLPFQFVFFKGQVCSFELGDEAESGFFDSGDGRVARAARQIVLNY